MMSWKDQKLALFTLIKEISDSYGGDDQEWLKEFTEDIVKTNKDGLCAAIEGFKRISLGSKTTSPESPKNDLNFGVCKICNYRLVFCRCR